MTTRKDYGPQGACAPKLAASLLGLALLTKLWRAKR